MSKLAEGKDKIFERLIEAGIATREEIEAEVQKYNNIVTQTVPWNGGARLAPIKSTKSNWAVGEAYKMNTAHDPRKRNIHDPENQYRWEDEGEGWFIWTMRALGALGFIVGIYSLVFLGMLL